MKAILLGAGASYDCAMPLVWELTAELRRFLTPDKLISYNQNWKPQGGGWDDDVPDTVLTLLKNKSIHYESIIGAIEVEFNRTHDQDKRQNYHAALGFFLQIVYGLLLERQIKNTPFIIRALDDFVGLKKIAEESQPLWIFSLNHDCILEMLALKDSIPLKSGFGEEIEIGMRGTDTSPQKIIFERLNREDIKNNKYDFFRHGEFGINLIKLHGSLDIFGQSDELNYIKIKPQSDPASYISKLALIDKINLDISMRDGVGITNEYVYHDEFGQIQFLRKTLLSGAHKFSKKMTQIAPPEFLSIFKGNLNYADELICIGYSFGDKHIDDEIIDWLSFLKSRKLTVINPGIKDCPDRFKHLTNQVECKPMGAADYFHEIGSRKLSTLDNALRNLGKAAREKIRKELMDNDC